MRIHCLLVPFLLTAACKDNAPNDKSGPEDQVASETGSETGNETEAPIEPVAQVPRLGEVAVVVFEATSAKKRTVSWQLGDEMMQIHARETPVAEPVGYQVDLLGSLADRDDLLLYTCKELKSESAGRVELLLRGDQLHARCVNPPIGDDLGWTEAGRFQFESGTRQFKNTGSYSGEGVVDADTIDLDEADFEKADLQ